MNKFTSNNPNISTNEKSKLLSGQETFTLEDVKKLVDETNQCQRLYDEAREKRNSAIARYLKQNDTPDNVYQLAYEIKITPATIYKIIAQQEKKEI